MEITQKTSYTRHDYAALPQGAPYQLIEGKLVMSPAPAATHQVIIGRLHILLHTFVEQHQLGIVILSPLDVYLSDTNAFQPDLVFISNERLSIIGNHVEGAPDLAIEVLSPSTARYDLKQKKAVYESTGVREYWIVDPVTHSTQIFTNTEEGFMLHQYQTGQGSIASCLFEGISIDISDLFRPIHPSKT